MEIKKLIFNSDVWGVANKAVSLKAKRIDARNTVVEYSNGNGENFKFVLMEENLFIFNQKLKELDFNKWKDSYNELVLDGEEWNIMIEYSNKSKKEIVGRNGYPQGWNCLLALIEWIKGIGKSLPELTYEEAKQKALSINPKVNFCREYTEAYHFFDLGGELRTPDNDIVVIKKTGKTFNFATFVIEFNPEHNAKTIKF